MTDTEFAILDELYFPVSFETLTRTIEKTEGEMEILLNVLLDKGFIDQLQFDQVTNDFVKQEQPDFSALKGSFFVASKKGLLAHNGTK